MHLPGRSTTYRAFFVGLCRNVGKPTINIGCRDPPSTLSFSKIQTGGKRKWQIAILIILILGPMLMYGKVSQVFDRQQPCYSVKIKGNYIENRWKT